MNPKRTSQRVPRASLGFTLIELLVVIGIMGLLAALAIPAATAANSRSAVPNAVNEINASLIAARALAISEQTDAAVIFCSSGTQSNGPILVRVCIRKTDINAAVANTPNIRFVTYDSRDAIKMSANVRVAGPVYMPITGTGIGAKKPRWYRPGSIDDSATAVSENRIWLGVCFDSTGKIKPMDSELLTKAYFDADNNQSFTGSITLPTTSYYYSNTLSTGDRLIRFVPALAIYSTNLFAAAIAEGDVTETDQNTSTLTLDNPTLPSLSNFDNWINNANRVKDDAGTREDHFDNTEDHRAMKVHLIMFNSYTGQIIR